MVRKIIVVLALGLAALVAMSFTQRGGINHLGPSAGPDFGGRIAYARSGDANSGGIWIYSGGDQHQLTKGPHDRQGTIWRAVAP